MAPRAALLVRALACAAARRTFDRGVARLAQPPRSAAGQGRERAPPMERHTCHTQSGWCVPPSCPSCLIRSFGCTIVVTNDNIEDPLLDTDDESSSLNPERREEHQAAVSVPEALLRVEFRRPLAIVCFSMLCQQLSGLYSLPSDRKLYGPLTSYLQV